MKPLAPSGPTIQDNSLGAQAQSVTYQDLLKVLIFPKQSVTCLMIDWDRGISKKSNITSQVLIVFTTSCLNCCVLRSYRLNSTMVGKKL